MAGLGEGRRPGQVSRASGLPCPLLSEPICAIGHGVAALCCATNEDRSWVFQGYSVTGVSALRGSQAALGPMLEGRGPWSPLEFQHQAASSPCCLLSTTTPSTRPAPLTSRPAPMGQAPSHAD